MKTFKLFSPGFSSVAIIVLFSAFVLTSCSKDNDAEIAATYSVSGTASGAQMVPSVQGNGSAALTGTYNSNTRTLVYTTNWANLSGAPTMGRFYTGATGQNGTAIGTAWNLGTTPGVSGSTTGTLVLTEAQQTALLNGEWYFILGTATNANGEVRGQLTATPQ